MGDQYRQVQDNRCTGWHLDTETRIRARARVLRVVYPYLQLDVGILFVRGVVREPAKAVAHPCPADRDPGGGVILLVVVVKVILGEFVGLSFLHPGRVSIGYRGTRPRCGIRRGWEIIHLLPSAHPPGQTDGGGGGGGGGQEW